jgi:hypothetical protein
VAAAAKWYEGAIAAYQPKGAASLAASYVNLVTPGTLDAIPVVEPGWSVDGGWLGTGTQWLRTGIVIADNNQSIIVRFANHTLGNNQSMAGQFAGNTNQGTLFQTNLTADETFYNGGSVRVATQTVSGVRAIAGQKAYKDGQDLGITIPAYTQANNGQHGILAYNLHTNTGAIARAAPFLGNILAIAFYNFILTPAEVTTVSAAMAAL